MSSKLFLSILTLFVLASLPFISSVGASSTMWSQTYGSGGAHSLVETSDGGFALAGYTTSVYAGPADCWLVKTDEYGNIPEFPSWTILPLLLVTTLAAIIYRKKLYRTQTQQSY